jgi:uncharacterized protein involved in exopolysaccharide biosynthesis
MNTLKNRKWIIAAVAALGLALVALWLKCRRSRSASQNNQTIDVRKS